MRGREGEGKMRTASKCQSREQERDSELES